MAKTTGSEAGLAFGLRVFGLVLMSVGYTVKLLCELQIRHEHLVHLTVRSVGNRHDLAGKPNQDGLNL
jgi:hypothetical protein